MLNLAAGSSVCFAEWYPFRAFGYAVVTGGLPRTEAVPEWPSSDNKRPSAWNWATRMACEDIREPCAHPAGMGVPDEAMALVKKAEALSLELGKKDGF